MACGDNLSFGNNDNTVPVGVSVANTRDTVEQLAITVANVLTREQLKISRPIQERFIGVIIYRITDIRVL